MSPASGGRFGSYEIVSLLGVGGMGEVYRARDTRPTPIRVSRAMSALVGALRSFFNGFLAFGMLAMRLANALSEAAVRRARPSEAKAEGPREQADQEPADTKMRSSDAVMEFPDA